MIVGENRPAIHTETGTEAFVFATLPTITVLLPDGEYVDPAPTVEDISAVPGYDEANLTHKLSAPIAWEQGGEYRLRWFLHQDGQNPIIREEVYFAAWTDVYSVIRSQGYLNRSLTQLPDSVIDPVLAQVTQFLSDEYACLGDYNDLTGNDRRWFDETLAYMVSAQLRPGLSRLASDGDMVKRRQGDTEYTWADRSKAQAESLETQWTNAAWDAFRRVSCIADIVAATRADFRVFALSGRRRAAERAGNIVGTENPLLRYLIDEERRLQGVGVYLT